LFDPKHLDKISHYYYSVCRSPADHTVCTVYAFCLQATCQATSQAIITSVAFNSSFARSLQHLAKPPGSLDDSACFSGAKVLGLLPLYKAARASHHSSPPLAAVVQRRLQSRLKHLEDTRRPLFGYSVSEMDVFGLRLCRPCPQEAKYDIVVAIR
jgi:hypothetical protein